MQIETLQQAIQHFSDEETCVRFVADMRWPNGVQCPHCDSQNVPYVKSRRIWQCKDCRKQFSVKAGTIFEDSPISLSKWICAMWLLVNAKNGISSYEIHRSLGVTQKTAWFMMHRIRLALQRKSFKKLKGNVEADETYIGGAARNMHFGKRSKVLKGRSLAGKAVVMGLLERKGEVRTSVVETASGPILHEVLAAHVKPGSNLFTDEWTGYKNVRINRDYLHKVINHSETYVRGQVHTNGIENFWSLLKRGIKGTYVSVEPFHLFRYLDEQAFRFNTRKGTDLERFVTAFSGIVGRRVQYQQLIGQTSH